MERRRRLPGALAAAVVFILASTYLLLSSPHDGSPAVDVEHTAARHFQAPKTNIWSDLKQHEAEEVYGFLVKEWAGLNLTRSPNTSSDNFIVSIETLQPNKSHVVPYLFENQSKPSRWAKIVLSHHKEASPFLSYYAVGPLPVSPDTKAEPLTYPFNSGRNSVPNLLTDYVGSAEFGLTLGQNVSDITTELLGARVNREDPTDPDSLNVFTRFTRLGPDLVVGWLQFFRPGLGSSGRTLLPQGLYARVDASREVGSWTVGEWWYNGQMFKDADHLRQAMRQGDDESDEDGSSGFLRTEPNKDGAWTDTEDFDAHPAGRELPPPVSIQPLGPRYRLDREERFVSWFGFEFYFSSTQATGVSVYDIRFRGDRVMYELSLQEAMAHYAGDDPMAGGQEFLDAFFGMGTNAFELLPGYDCPGYADYLDSELHRAGKTERLYNNVCLFEFTSDHLLSRHTAQYSVTASRNTYLTLRSVSTVGNYDYTIDYIFYLDGAIEVKVRASGYIYGAFYASNPYRNEDEYGHRVHDALSSSLHDHVISFKADLDVAGTANDMVRLAVEPTTTSYPWDQPHVPLRSTMHLVERPVTHETGLDWPRNAAEMYLVYASPSGESSSTSSASKSKSSATNRWGERRGYRIAPGTGMGNPPHLTVLNSTSLGRSARWAERDIWVLRRKDEEPRAADPLSYLDTANPLVDFSLIADGETLEQHLQAEDEQDAHDGDLVVYFNLGSHHVPHSGDIPNTLMHTSASSVVFAPHNFADRDPSRESVQGVRLQLRGTRSGGFAGFPEPDDGGRGEPGKSWPSGQMTDDLRSRGGEADEQRAKKKARRGSDEEGSAGGERGAGYERHEGANYFGTPYTEGVYVPLEALEPDLARRYKTREVRVSDLALNGSAAGLWAP